MYSSSGVIPVKNTPNRKFKPGQYFEYDNEVFKILDTQNTDGYYALYVYDDEIEWFSFYDEDVMNRITKKKYPELFL